MQLLVVLAAAASLAQGHPAPGQRIRRQSFAQRQPAAAAAPAALPGAVDAQTPHPVEWLSRLPRVLDARNACPPFGLPINVYSSPEESSASSRHGRWETFDGAGLAAWTQTELGEQTAMDVTVAGRLFYRLTTTVLDPDQSDPKHPGRETAVVTAENCDGVPIFNVLEHPGGDAPLELYVWTEDQKFEEKNLLVKGFVSSLDPTDFIWRDADNVSLAVAQDKAPSLAQNEKMATEDLEVFGGVRHFVLKFFDGSLVNQSKVEFLLDPHVRFMLAAATQFRQLREADRGQGGTVRILGESRHLQILERILKAMGLLAALLAVFALLYVCIYPRDGKQRSQLVDRVKAWAEKYRKKQPSQLQGDTFTLQPRALEEQLVDSSSLRLRDGRTILKIDGRPTDDRRHLDLALQQGRNVTVTVGYDHATPWSDAVDFGKAPGESIYRAAASAPAHVSGQRFQFADAYRPDLGYGTTEPAFVPAPDVRHHAPGPVRLYSD